MRIIIPIFLFACSAGNGKNEADNLLGDSDRPVWNPDPQTISNSSSSATVSWSPPDAEENDGETPLFYNVVIESEFGLTSTDVDIEETIISVDNLRSDTEYTLKLTACFDEDCSSFTSISAEESTAWRSEVEKWHIIGMREEGFTPLLPNTHSPSLIDLSNLDIGIQGWIMSSITSENNVNSINISTLFGVYQNGEEYDLELTSPVNSGLQDTESFALNATTLRVISETENRIELFVSGDATDLSVIGSWSATLGLDGDGGLEASIYDQEGLVCDNNPYVPCSMNTCLESGDIHDIADLSIIQQNFTDKDRLLIQAQSDPDSTSPGNLYLAETQNDLHWTPIMQNGIPVPLIKYATCASVNNKEGISKLYYFDEVSGSPQLRYWDSSLFGDSDALDIEDLEGTDRVRNVYYVNDSGDTLRPSEYRIIDSQFFKFEDNKPMMMVTIQNTIGEMHTTLGVLENP
jgi:hypothetical protein